MHPVSRASLSWCLAAVVASALVAATPGCSNQESGSRADDASGDDDDTSGDDDDTSGDDDDTSGNDEDTSGDDDDDHHTGIDMFSVSWGQATVDGLAGTFDGALTQSWQNQSDGTICSVTWAGVDTVAAAPSNLALCELDGSPS